MNHRPILTTILITICSIGFYCIAYLVPSNPHKRTQFEITQTQAEYDHAAVSGARLGLGLPPTLIVQGTAHFTLENLKGVQFHIPREHLELMPNEPDGETDMISMSFYLPNMDSAATLLKNNTYDQNLPFEVRVTLSTQTNYIHCWGNQCLDQPFALFQNEIQFFQQFPRGETKNLQPIALKNKHYVKSLNLDAYQGRKQNSTNEGIMHDIIYLSPRSNPRNPSEWIKCEGYACNHHRFRDGMLFKTSFSRDLITKQAEIRNKVDMKIEEYMTKI